MLDSAENIVTSLKDPQRMILLNVYPYKHFKLNDVGVIGVEAQSGFLVYPSERSFFLTKNIHVPETNLGPIS